jgi:hypothetical protein
VKHRNAFFPNFIHSIDGFYMRAFTLNIFKEFNYIIEPLHDSISATPNLIPAVRRVVSKVYFENQLNRNFILENLIQINIGDMEDSKKNEIFDLFSELSFGEEQISLSFDQ